jgi:hypothetical protein
MLTLTAHPPGSPPAACLLHPAPASSALWAGGGAPGRWCLVLVSALSVLSVTQRLPRVQL